MRPAEAPAEGDAGTDRPDEPEGTADLVDATVQNCGWVRESRTSRTETYTVVRAALPVGS